MHASDLQTDFPMVSRDTTALEAAREIAEGQLAGLVVVDGKRAPVAVVSAADILRLMIPGYILEDMSLAGVFDEKGAEDFWSLAGQHTIGELIDDQSVRVYDLLRVDADATIVELAAQMAEARAQVAVVKGDGPPQFIRLPAVMDAILKFCS